MQSRSVINVNKVSIIYVNKESYSSAQYTFFYKNKLYKNSEAQILVKIGTIKEQCEAQFVYINHKEICLFT